MANSKEHALRWLDLILQQRLPKAVLLAQHVAAGHITRLCPCGCHGFEFEVPAEAALPPLAHSSGLFCELAFSSDQGEEIEILVFTDKHGFFSGADVTYGPNVEPMPEEIQPRELLGIWPTKAAEA